MHSTAALQRVRKSSLCFLDSVSAKSWCLQTAQTALSEQRPSCSKPDKTERLLGTTLVIQSPYKIMAKEGPEIEVR